MKKILIFTFCFVSFIGCSNSAVEQNSNSNQTTAERKTANIEEINVSAAAENSLQNVNQAAPAAQNSNKKKPEMTTNNPAQSNIKSSSAPEDSTVSLEMNNQGQPIETRAFRNHPSLSKVERIYVNPQNPQIKVYLKDGRIFDLPENSIENVLTASSRDILKAVGIEPPPEDKNFKKRENKKKGERKM